MTDKKPRLRLVYSEEELELSEFPSHVRGSIISSRFLIAYAEDSAAIRNAVRVPGERSDGR